MRKPRGVVRYQLPALFWALLIFVSSSIPGSHYPEVNLEGIDKAIHFVIYGTLCLFLYIAVRHQQRYPFLSRHAMIVSLGLTTLFGLTDELHQLQVPGRSCDMLDLMTDVLGGLVCLLVLWTYGRFFSRRSAVSGT